MSNIWFGEYGTDKEMIKYFNYKGIYIDVGAGHPETYSNSYAFRELGWSVIPIEPNPYLCEEYSKRGLSVYQYAVGDNEIDDAEFNICSVSDGMSYSALEYRYRPPRRCSHKKIKVKVRKLDTILSDLNIKNIDILDVDVEGWELDVVKTLSICRPKLVVLENFKNDGNYEVEMNNLGYSLDKKVSYNWFFI